jgi:hypothetical protein
MSDKQAPFSELNQLAIEACDMWQEHLSTLASNPDARSELTRFLEPQRRLFADWASMMRQEGTGKREQEKASKQENDTTKPAPVPEPTTAPAEAPRGAAHGDDSLRVAQLALRVAELEKRLAKLESKPAGARKA